MSEQKLASPPPPAEQPNPSSSPPPMPSSIPTLRPKNQKPNFARPVSSDLQSRLQAFLPQMAAANAELEKLAQEPGGLEGKRLEDVGEGDEYVEMELGLGVMEEKKKEGEDSSDESSSSSSSEESFEDDQDSSDVDSGDGGDGGEDGDDDVDADGEMIQQQAKRKKQKEKEQKEKDILGRLMGHKQGRREKAAGIQEVD